MIQRIQSVWLLLSALCIVLLSRLGIYHGVLVDGTKETLMAAQRMHLMILALLLIVLPLIAIFLFKNRVAQKKLIYTHILLNLLTLLFFWMAKDAFDGDTPSRFTESFYGVGVAVPVFSIIFDILAYRGIRRDEKLIKAADKFR
jgi:hypothetical protein